MKTTIYNTQGKEAGSIDLPETYFGVSWNEALMHEVVVSMQSNQRSGLAQAKDRSAVAGGGKKPWKQKGTGRARHGSSRSPIWIGGGVTHGPLAAKDYSKKINRKVMAKALATALSAKLEKGQMVLVDQLTGTAKTKAAREALKALAEGSGQTEMATRRNNGTLVAVSEKSENELGLRNLPGVAVTEIRNLNPLDILSYRYLVVENPATLISSLEQKFESRK